LFFKSDKKEDCKMPYWRLHYHAVWACKNRERLITPEFEPQLHEYIFGKGTELGAIMHAVDGIEDHLHSVFSLGPKFSLSDFIGNLKGASSHWVTHVLKHPLAFDWQRGYGVVTFGDRHFKQVIHYVRNQKQHHQNQSTNNSMEKWSEDEDGVVVVWDERL
jgi:REP element-mobilizing transposase RayT